MCNICDVVAHKHQPLHDREVWYDGICGMMVYLGQYHQQLLAVKLTQLYFLLKVCTVHFHNNLDDNFCCYMQGYAFRSAFHGDVLFVVSEQ